MYTQAVMIGYQAPTVGGITHPPVWGTTYVECGWPPPPAPAIVTNYAHLRLPQPLTNPDMQNRFLRMAYVINETYHYYHTVVAPPSVPLEASDPHQVLKVFTMPEFYFRPPAPAPAPPGPRQYGAYTIAELWELIDAIGHLLEADELQDWLFVCGTAIATDAQIAIQQPMVYNYAILKMGGLTGVERSIYKEMTSSIDGVMSGSEPDPVFASASRAQTLNRNRVIADLGIGLEICLDHGEGVLQRVMNGWGAGAPQIKLHLIVAGGMHIDDDEVAAANGKYVFRNDGLCSSTARIELKSVNRPAVGHTTTSDIPAAFVMPMPVPAQMSSPPDHPHGPYPVMAQQVLFFLPQLY